jgi:hypothetical protein
MKRLKLPQRGACEKQPAARSTGTTMNAEQASSLQGRDRATLRSRLSHRPRCASHRLILLLDRRTLHLLIDVGNKHGADTADTNTTRATAHSASKFPSTSRRTTEHVQRCCNSMAETVSRKLRNHRRHTHNSSGGGIA